MADNYDNTFDTYLELKGIGIEDSHSGTFEGGAVGKSGNALFSEAGAKRMDFRFSPEFSQNMLKGLINLYPTLAKDLISATTYNTNHELATANGVKLSIHIGARKREGSSKVFNAGFGYLKPLQYAPGKEPATTQRTKRVVQAVGGDVTIPEPESFKK